MRRRTVARLAGHRARTVRLRAVAARWVEMRRGTACLGPGGVRVVRLRAIAACRVEVRILAALSGGLGKHRASVDHVVRGRRGG